MSLEVAVRLVGNVAVVDMTGRFTLGADCDLLRDTVKELLESGRKQILLSLNGVTYIDSSGLGQLASCYVTASRLGGHHKILNAQGKVNHMLQVTRLFSVLVAFSDEAEAIRSFSNA
jgi:anti-sigma B factor antagonist